MATDTDITGALFARLAALTLTPTHQIAWPNVEFTPPSSGKFLRANEIPVSAVAVSVAADGSNEYRGIFQVDVFGPLGAGLPTQKAIAAAVSAQFKRGLTLYGGSTRLDVTGSFVGPAMVDKDRAMIPVSINYRAFARNA